MKMNDTLDIYASRKDPVDLKEFNNIIPQAGKGGKGTSTKTVAADDDEEDIDSESVEVKKIDSYIQKQGSQHCVKSESGKNLGCSPTKGGAKKRLAQVEYFKHKKG